MTAYDFGEVVLVDFPQSGTTERKRRPAVVVLDIGDADVVLAPVTTKQRSGAGDLPLRDWSASGLLRASWVRLAKVACLEKSDVVRRLGRLGTHDQDRVTAGWRSLYALAAKT
jgi:mRNA interferase MazF